MVSSGVAREVVLTGGPGAGKSTAITLVAQRLRDDGWRVLVAPEAATLFIAGGIPDIAEVAQDPTRFEAFQDTLVRTQAALRDQYRRMATALGDRRTVILYDRAECDTAAYVGPRRFDEMLAASKRSLLTVRDSYDAVVHLVSPAVDAPQHYTLGNNAARTEPPARAAELDAATLAAWLGHPRLSVVGNQGGFDTKLDKVLAAVHAALGEPAPLEVERKFALLSPPPPQRLEPLQRCEITQVYLTELEPGSERRVRRYAERGALRFELTVKQRVSPTVRVEREQHIDRATFDRLVACEARPDARPVRKTRFSLGDCVSIRRKIRPK